jgi:hypothetical protein
MTVPFIQWKWTHPWYILAPTGLIVIDVDTLQLQVAGSLVGAAGIHTVLVTDDLPELQN